MHRVRSLITLLVAASLGVSCTYVGIGDVTHDIYYTNAASSDVFVYEQTPTGTTPPYRVQPGATFHNSTIVPAEEARARSTTKRRWVAKDGNGDIIFCHEYTYAQLDAIDWRITIRPQLDCGGEP